MTSAITPRRERASRTVRASVATLRGGRDRRAIVVSRYPPGDIELVRHRAPGPAGSYRRSGCRRRLPQLYYRRPRFLSADGALFLASRADDVINTTAPRSTRRSRGGLAGARRRGRPARLPWRSTATVEARRRDLRDRPPPRRSSPAASWARARRASSTFSPPCRKPRPAGAEAQARNGWRTCWRPPANL